MQLAYRATRRHQPNKSDTLVSSREQAFKLIENLDKKLATKLPKQERATYLCGRAVLYEALGDKQMLEAAEAAYAFSKTAQSAALVAVALHHYGRIKEAIEWYERSYKYPHEAGFEIDIGMQGALLFSDDPTKWAKAWEITKQLKKRICYAAYLPTWDGKPVEKLQVLSEGGFGDVWMGSRYLQRCTEIAKHVTVYLPPFFFEHGFVDLAKQQPWYPEIKPLTEVTAGIPSAGFFDLPAIFETLPSAVPPPPIWNAGNTAINLRPDKPKVGFVWGARAMETPLVEAGIYRSLTDEQATRIIHQTSDRVGWVSLQHNATDSLGICAPEIKSWEDTAAIIKELDLVVTVDTAVAHLAASLNKPTWVILSGAVDWKFSLSGDTCRWYPQWRLFRNEGFGFENSVAKVIQELARL